MTDRPAARTIALSLAVSVAAALAILYSFAVVFYPSGEFFFIQAGIVVYLCFAAAVFALVYARAQGSRIFALAAIALVTLAFVIAQVPATGNFLDAQSTNPFKMGQQFFVETAYQILAPLFVAIVIQWQFVQRAWLKARGESSRAVWPWITTILAAVVAFNPLGIAILQSAIKRSPTDWLSGLWVTVTLIAIGVLIAVGFVEYCIRRRKSRRAVAGA